MYFLYNNVKLNLLDILRYNNRKCHSRGMYSTYFYINFLLILLIKYVFSFSLNDAMITSKFKGLEKNIRSKKFYLVNLVNF